MKVCERESWQLSATLTLGPEPAIVNNLDPWPLTLGIKL